MQMGQHQKMTPLKTWYALTNVATRNFASKFLKYFPSILTVY